MAWTAKKFRFAECQSVSMVWHIFICSIVKNRNFFLGGGVGILVIIITLCVKGLDRAVGGRRFLEVLVLSCPVRHYVFMEAICKQPKASSLIRQSHSPAFFFPFHVIFVINQSMSTGMLSPLSWTTLTMRRLMSSSPLETLVRLTSLPRTLQPFIVT